MVCEIIVVFETCVDKVVGHQQKSIALHIEGIDKIILSPLGDNYDAISSYNKMDLLM